MAKPEWAKATLADVPPLIPGAPSTRHQIDDSLKLWPAALGASIFRASYRNI
jgi:hypothetical protein